MRKLELVTSTGHTLRLKPVPPHVVLRMALSLKFPERPYYEHEIAGGEKEKVFHDETTITTPEEREQWEAYLQGMDDADVEFQERKTKLYIRYGVDVDLPDDWKGTKADYIEQKCIGTYTDVMSLLRGIDMLSQVNQEELSEIERLFRRQMEGSLA